MDLIELKILDHSEKLYPKSSISFPTNLWVQNKKIWQIEKFQTNLEKRDLPNSFLDPIKKS